MQSNPNHPEIRFSFLFGQRFNFAGLACFALGFALIILFGNSENDRLLWLLIVIKILCTLVVAAICTSMYLMRKSDVRIGSQKVIIRRVFYSDSIQLSDAQEFSFERYFFRPGYYVTLNSKTGEKYRTSFLTPNGDLSSRLNDPLRVLVASMNLELNFRRK